MRTLVLTCALLSIACDGSSPPGDDASVPDVDAAPGDAGIGTDDAGTVTPSRTVTTTGGDVVGVEEDGVEVFRSIPYAAPPVGALRFARPMPHAGWSDVLDTATTDPTLSCPQVDRMSGAYEGEEDCLVLNVFAPTSASGRPVMVFIHGGGFTGGTANDALYDGVSLASRDVVVVTMNYRLGILGFLATPELVEADGGAGDLGLWDQRLALEWVRDNAAAFGGDPSDVTIFGESAGAVSVLAQMTSPGSAGLFARAIVESGGGGFGTATQAEAMTRYEPIVEALGCDGDADVPACLRAVDVDTILGATNAAGMSVLGLPAIGPHLDGVFLTDDPYARIASGAVDVPFMVGSNADEATVFTSTIPVPTRAAMRTVLVNAYDDATADAVLAIYDEATYPTAKAAFNGFFGEVGFVCPTIALAEAGADGEPAYVYHFTRVLPGPAAALGAFHGLELFYVFGNTDSSPAYTPNADDAALVETMQRAWVGYASTGAPDFVSGWSAYDPASPSFGVFDEPAMSATEIVEGRCAELAALGLGRP